MEVGGKTTAARESLTEHRARGGNAEDLTMAGLNLNPKEIVFDMT